MWPFSTPNANPSPPPQTPAAELDALRRDVVSLAERLDALTREQALLKTEWADVLDRISRHFARAAAREQKRLQRDMATVEDSDSREDASGAPITAGSVPSNPQDHKAHLRALVAQRLGRRTG